jgi:hypothetical protein
MIADVILFLVALVVLCVFCFKMVQVHGETLGLRRAYDHFKQLHQKENTHADVSSTPPVVLL